MKRRSLRSKNGPKPERAQLFEDYFNSIYGERWAKIREGLRHPPRQQVLKNPFSDNLQDYRLDVASLAPTHHLDARIGHRIADFCASPGGKSLSLIFALKGEASFSCNDLSPGRVQRLKAVFHDCLPAEIFARIDISRSDASRWGLSRKEEFDRILIDAPCSGERHLLESPQELGRWSMKGVKGLAVRQHALLCSALDCLKSGGRAVYSTCSINPLENDGVIERLKESREGLFEVIPVENELGETTANGRLILPDRDACGPIYFSVLEKN